MKKFLMSALLASFLIQNVWAEEGSKVSERNFAVTAQPLSLIGGTARVAFQYRFFDWLALSVPMSIGKDWWRPLIVKISSSNESTMSPFDASVGVGARFFPRNNGFRDGFYVEPNLRVARATGDIERNSDKFHQVTWKSTFLKPTLRIGYSWFWDSGFMMSWGFDIGASYAFRHEYKVHEGDSKQERTYNNKVFKWFMDVQDNRWSPTFDTEWSMGFSW